MFLFAEPSLGGGIGGMGPSESRCQTQCSDMFGRILTEVPTCCRRWRKQEASHSLSFSDTFLVAFLLLKSPFGSHFVTVWGYFLDAAFLLTVASFLLTVELSYLQLTILAFLLTVGACLLTVLASLLTVGASLLTVGKCV